MIINKKATVTESTRNLTEFNPTSDDLDNNYSITCNKSDYELKDN